MPLELYQTYTLTMPSGLIGETGIEAALRMLQSERLDNELWRSINPDLQRHYMPILPDDWAWVWTVTGKASYVGTFPKRIRSWLYKEHGIKAPDFFIEKLGAAVKPHTAGGESYEFEFVNNIDWHEGDFGDDGSCYWNGRAGARKMLENNGGLAIRFYDERYHDGMARAWIVPVGDWYAVFNGYGFAGDPTLIITRVLAQHLNVSYKRISLSNQGVPHGTLYINGSGTGYAVGAIETITPIARHDFNWANETWYTCASCGDDIDESYTGADDEDYCRECYYNIFDDCADCGDTEWRDEMELCGDHWVCRDCADDYRLCVDCEETYHHTDTVLHDNLFYCRDCYERIQAESEDKPDVK